MYEGYTGDDPVLFASKGFPDPYSMDSKHVFAYSIRNLSPHGRVWLQFTDFDLHENSMIRVRGFHVHYLFLPPFLVYICGYLVCYFQIYQNWNTSGVSTLWQQGDPNPLIWSDSGLYVVFKTGEDHNNFHVGFRAEAYYQAGGYVNPWI